MSILEAFRRQAEKKQCSICGNLVSRGVYRSHSTVCKLPSDDDDCLVVKEIHLDDENAEDGTSLNDSSDLFENVNSENREMTSAVENASMNIDKWQKRTTNVQKNAKFQKLLNPVRDKIGSKSKISRTCSRIPKKRPKKINLSVLAKTEEGTTKIDAQFFTEKKNKTVLENKAVTLKQNSGKDETPSYLDEISENFHIFRSADMLHCEPTTSRKVKEEPEQSLHDVLQSIQTYLNATDCNLQSSQHFSNHKSSGSELHQIVSPYYLTLFHKILKRTFCDGGMYGKVEFWEKHLNLLQKFVNLSDKSKLLLIRLFLRKWKWLTINELSYPDISSSLEPLFEELTRAELVDSSDFSLNDITEAVYLLRAPSLKAVAKEFKLEFNKSKTQIRCLLLRFAAHKNVFGISMEKRVLHTIKKKLGACYRLCKRVLNLFMAVFTLYSPIDMNSTLLFDQPSINLPSNLLFILLQVGTDKIRYPAPNNPSIINIYTDSEKLFRYVEAKELEAEIANLTQRGSWSDVIQCAGNARDKYERSYLTQREFCESLEGHLRRFTDLHVYARCISRGAEAFEKIKDYQNAVEWLKYLLHTKKFNFILGNARGGWWNRLALNLDVHLKDKNQAMEAVTEGLQDPALGDKDRLLLQDRGRKLLPTWRGPLIDELPERIDIEGSVLAKRLGETRINRFMIKKAGVLYECNVEEVALNHYIRKKGFKEDMLPVIKMEPADLNTRSFYTRRMDLFELRLKEIEELSFDELLLEMEETYTSHYGVTNSEISWDCFDNFEQIKVSLIFVLLYLASILILLS
ncbi:unnamed protein product [Thelazia callipaeda]|uniref:Fanconi-associated nuclease n=1 Tax=Thelazia callipaeda TaxID=103827 RepID=A0A0N5DBM9_THECL|nr:unnamed protein product [Thelazia callipaeda]